MNQSSDDRVTTAPIASERVTFDRKVFFLDLKENQRGRFLKISEDVIGRRNTILLPASAFEEFTKALKKLIDAHAKM